MCSPVALIFFFLFAYWVPFVCLLLSCICLYPWTIFLFESQQLCVKPFLRNVQHRRRNLKLVFSCWVIQALSFPSPVFLVFLFELPPSLSLPLCVLFGHVCVILYMWRLEMTVQHCVFHPTLWFYGSGAWIISNNSKYNSVTFFSFGHWFF